jgi:hypothetical protein
MKRDRKAKQTINVKKTERQRDGKSKSPLKEGQSEMNT